MRETAKIVGFCVLASVVYGVLHDLVTAHICLEYFTVFHPLIIQSHNPVVQALFWGVFATWWMGAIFGLLIASAARLGERPKLGWRQVAWPVAILLTTTGALAFLAGDYGSGVNKWYSFAGPIEGVDPRDFNACLFSHNVSYFASGGGALVVCLMLWARRVRVTHD